MLYSLKNLVFLLWAHVGLMFGWSQIDEVFAIAVRGALEAERRESWFSQQVLELMPLTYLLLLIGTYFWLSFVFSQRFFFGHEGEKRLMGSIMAQRRGNPSPEPQSGAKEQS